MAIVIREPRCEDFPAINALGSWLKDNSSYAGCGWSETKIAIFIIQAADPESNVYMRVVEKDGLVIGVFLGHVIEYFFSEEKLGQELVMLFKPAHRQGILKTVITLLNEFTDFAKERGAKEVCAGISTGIAGDNYKKLLNRLGFQDSGVITKRII